jgi:sugar phosphate isomerase/epimerase
MILGGVRGKLAGDPATWEAQREGAIGSMREVARYAASQGVQAVIEPINRYETNFINTAAEGLAAIEAIGEPSVKLLLDTFHMNIEEADIPETVRRAGARIGYVHFADSNRRAPGAGHTRFAEILGALAEVGYGGYVGAEILPLPDDRSAVEQAALFLRAQPARAG